MPSPDTHDAWAGISTDGEDSSRLKPDCTDHTNHLSWLWCAESHEPLQSARLELLNFSGFFCTSHPWRGNDLDCQQDIHGSRTSSPFGAACQSCWSFLLLCTVTFAAMFLIKSEEFVTFCSAEIWRLLTKNKVVYELQNCFMCTADREEQRGSSQSSLIGSVVGEGVCVLHSRYSVWGPRKAFFLFSLSGFCSFI